MINIPPMKKPIEIKGYIFHEDYENNRLRIRLPGIQNLIREEYGADILFEAVVGWEHYQPDLIIEFEFTTRR